MTEYPSNADVKKNISDEEKQPVTPVTKGGVKVKKKNAFEKTVLNEDMHNVWDYMLYDILIPTAKDTFSKLVSNSVDMILFGETRRGGSGGRKENYNSYYDSGRSRNDDRRRAVVKRDQFELDNIVFDYRDDAEIVLDRLIERVNRYRLATVADFYEFAGQAPEYTMHRYGWIDLDRRNAYVDRLPRDGYVIRLPKPVVID